MWVDGAGYLCRLGNFIKTTMDYGPSILHTLKKYAQLYPGAPRLSSNDVEIMVNHANTPSLWVVHRLWNKWEVNFEAGQIRNARTKKLIGRPFEGYIKFTGSGANNKGRGRCILLASSNPKDGETCDHINSAMKFDDRIVNLRWASKRDQALNRNMPSQRSDGALFQTSTTLDFKVIVDDGLDAHEAAKKYDITPHRVRCATRKTREGYRIAKLYWRHKLIAVASDAVEMWKPFMSYEGTTLASGYSISNLGNLKNLHGKVATVSQNASGYLRTSFRTENGTSKSIQLHRLVCYVFHGAPPTEQHTTVDHKNRNRLDNRADNLRWATSGEQAANKGDK